MPRRATLLVVAFAIVAHFAFVAPSRGAEPLAPARPLASDASDAFFENVEIPELRIVVAPKPLKKLQENPREYVKATLHEKDGSELEVGLKLKGAAGSYRDWEDRPALTIHTRKFGNKGTFRDLTKFHLNNSVQDETYAGEWLGSDVFRRAGIPAPRVTFARVWLNDRDVGLYVLKEGFDERFLKRWFPDHDGNLYEGAFVADLDGELEKDAGDGPDDGSDLAAIVEACRAEDPRERARRCFERVDLDQFLTFMGVERLLGHWDGYTSNGNNYRVYFRPATGKAIFLPHGMDQILGDPGMGLFDASDWMVAATVLESHDLVERYRARAEALPPLLAPEVMLPKLDLLRSKLQPTLRAIDPELAARHAERLAELRERIKERAEYLPRHLADPLEPVLEFDSRGVATVTDWYPEEEHGKITAQEDSRGGRRHYWVRVREPGAGSWRRRVLLGPGVYTLSVEARTVNVVKPDDDEPGGASIGLSGREREAGLVGTVPKTTLTHRFVVREDRKQHHLVLELRAKSGEAWFDVGSLRLTRKPLPPPED